jgi:non-lysosomal glucosylceramidase
MTNATSGSAQTSIPIQTSIPVQAWTRPIGLGWSNPYTVRYPSNIDDGPWHGMPLGGFGAGCIGRSHRGDFNLWHIDGGEHLFQSIPGCQFSVFEQVAGQSAQAYSLCTEAPTDGTLQQWEWYPASTDTTDTGSYAALYPRSWFTYRQVFQAELSCEQFSPIWAGNYQETSYPVAVFVWKAHNPTDQPLTLSVMLSWQNLVGWFTNQSKSPEVKVRDDGSPVYEYQPRWGQSAGNRARLIQANHQVGCVMEQVNPSVNPSATPTEGDGQWAIFTQSEQAELFYQTRWNPSGHGADLWQQFAQDGSLLNIDDSSPAAAGEQVGSAIALRFTLAPGETRDVPFVLAWDFPVTEFAEGVLYYRRYTDFFDRSGTNAVAIAQLALAHYQTWQQNITQWQAPILNNANLPDWFKMALFNELYDLTSGGTLWSAADESDRMGQFAVLECLDYRWYESLDVRLYGSFGLLMLFPELEKSVMRSFARAIPQSDDRTRTIGYYYTIGAESPQALRKAENATPHDLGAPNEHVWEKTNYTSYQDCNLWKDLGCDFVLLGYRDFVLTGEQDVAFLSDCWDAVVRTLDYTKQFDLDGDGIPENSGAPDQTFDDWRLQGVSAYCGGLWLAALEAAIAMGKILGHHTQVVEMREAIDDQIGIYQTWLKQSQQIYQEKLWNGRYYRLDSDSGSDVVMADQLCGQFYARLLELPDIVPEDCSQSALRTVYEACFLKFHGGKFGAANGLRPDGSPVNPKDTHPLEVWTGINFGLAAFMVQMGLKDEAMRLTETVVAQIYENGLQFRTPEAITAVGTFRASHYLRAMAIWGIYGVLEGF